MNASSESKARVLPTALISPNGLLVLSRFISSTEFGWEQRIRSPQNKTAINHHDLCSSERHPKVARTTKDIRTLYT